MTCHHSLLTLIALSLATVPGMAAGGSGPAGPPAPEQAARPDGDGGGARPSNALNPAISVNALLTGTWRRSDTADPAFPEDPGHGSATGIALQEAEVVFSAAVDPYFKADATVALADAGPEEEGFEVEIEEAFATALRFPRGFGLRAGKMYLPFGRHNLLHTHAFPFVSAPLVSEQVLGDEGLNEAGAELSVLLPVGWYSQLAFAVADGRNEMFAEARPQDLAWFGHWKQLWDLSESTTLELGLSGLYGKRGAEGEASATTWGGDLTVKHRPARQAVYRSFEAQAELLRRELGALEGEPDETLTGGYLHARWQATRRWWFQGRYDRTEREAGAESASENRWTALVAFTPSEFSALRLEYATLSPYEGDRDHQVRLQLLWSIGPHPAHSY